MYWSSPWNLKTRHHDRYRQQGRPTVLWQFSQAARHAHLHSPNNQHREDSPPAEPELYRMWRYLQARAAEMPRIRECKEVEKYARRKSACASSVYESLGDLVAHSNCMYKILFIAQSSLSSIYTPSSSHLSLCDMFTLGATLSRGGYCIAGRWSQY